MFRFKLEFLRRYRTQKEEMAMLELSKRVREANDIEIELEDLKERSREIAVTLSEHCQNGVSSTVYAMYMDYREHLRRCGNDATNRLDRAEKRMEEQRRRLVAASIDRQVLDRFRERQEECYQKQQCLSEQKGLDELAALARSRREHED
jgi:flagellar export protein FliJ